MPQTRDQFVGRYGGNRLMPRPSTYRTLPSWRLYLLAASIEPRMTAS